MKSVLMIAFMLAVVSTANAGSFYPACLKRDGDWLQGITRKECIGKDVRGQWVTGKALRRRQL